MSDNVYHPSHYCRSDGMECLDEMLMLYGPVLVAGFLICNSHKYRYRALNKNGAEDIAKSDRYARLLKGLIKQYPSELVDYLWDPTVRDWRS